MLLSALTIALLATDVAPTPRLIFGGSIFNVAPYAQAGVVFWRQSSTRLFADVRVAQNLLPSAFDHATALYPTELTGQVGIAW